MTISRPNEDSNWFAGMWQCPVLSNVFAIESRGNGARGRCTSSKLLISSDVMLRFRKCLPGCGADFEKLVFISITAETGRQNSWKIFSIVMDELRRFVWRVDRGSRLLRSETFQLRSESDRMSRFIFRQRCIHRRERDAYSFGSEGVSGRELRGVQQ